MKLVRKIDGSVDRKKVLATTYQMRNIFQQFADGAVSELDVHCYIQHMAAADLVPEGGRVLDVCCGRGLMLPFLRYGGNVPTVYVGVDIWPANAAWKDGADPRRRNGETKTDWGFDTIFVESNVSNMTSPVREVVGDRDFDVIVYTSAIEHMHPDHQRMSLVCCADLAHDGSVLYVTCPVTERGSHGYATQFAAHVYEPSETELIGWLSAAGWKVRQKIGLCTKATVFKRVLKGPSLRAALYLYSVMPRAFALPAIAHCFPMCATESAFVCKRS